MLGKRKRCPKLELAGYGNVKIQRLYGIWEKWGFVNVAVSRAGLFRECSLVELPFVSWLWGFELSEWTEIVQRISFTNSRWEERCLVERCRPEVCCNKLKDPQSPILEKKLSCTRKISNERAIDDLITIVSQLKRYCPNCTYHNLCTYLWILPQTGPHSHSLLTFAPIPFYVPQLNLLYILKEKQRVLRVNLRPC